MVDYRVTFKGDLGNLAQFDAAIRNSVTQSARAIEQANKTLLAQVGNFQGIFNPSSSGAGLFARNLKTEIDSVNRTFIQSGEVIRRVTAGFEVVTQQATKTKAAVSSIQEVFATQYESPYKKVIGDLDQYEAALKKIGLTEQKILRDREATVNRQLPLYNKINDLEQKRAVIQQRYNQEQETRQVSQAPIRTQLSDARAFQRTIDPADTAALKESRAQIRALQDQLRALKADEATALQPLSNSLSAIDAKIAATTAKLERLEASQLGRAAGLRSLNPGYAEKDAALIATPPIQKDLQGALNLSKDFQKKLLSLGLGGGAAVGTQEFQENLAKQEASLSRFTENARTNVKTIQGSFRDNIGRGATGILKDFTVELDKNNNVVGRWGGQLAGAGTFLRQTVRDFQKVVEWTVATTVVFGALATVVKQLGSINELNTSLARLSITAQTTSQGTQDLFSKIGEVAIQTATPLKELVKASDDIALAVRKAGDSTDEFQGKIIDLTRAVGIFTNLTGTDTVQATDQLSAAFKQLGIEPAQLIGILNKVTAVAGGQSTAINDIVKSLAGLSEAAKAAGLSVDEQIASIQVLSQVTNKSSDEVATSFKNLFGAVSSVGSEKILKSFGINIRDAQGGLKGFLDIYKEVKDAIDSGVIPQNRLPDVLRGISGGPRRAPDAAALLANLDKIFQVVGKSAGATNEALVANAKILDTNAAKITQFQNAVDIAVFQKFGDVVKDLTETLVGLGTVGANLFAGIPTEVVSLTIKLGALVLVIKTLGSVAKITGISGALGELARGFTKAGAEAGVAATKITAAGAATSGVGGVGGVLSKFTANKKLLGLGLGVGAGAALAGSGAVQDSNSIGSLAQLGGSVALLIPGLQEVGIALIAGGTALQLFSGDSQKAAVSAADVTKNVLTLTDSLRASQTDANNFAEAQAKAAAQIAEISTKTTKTVNDQKLLSAATDDYVSATLSLASANQTVSKTFDDLLKQLPGLAKGYKDFIGLTREQLGSKQIQDLRNLLVKDLLKATGQDIFAGTPLQASKTYTENNGTSTVAPFKAQATQPFNFYGGGNQAAQYNQQASLDLTTLLKDPAFLKKIFNVNNGAGTSYDIPQNQVALGYLQGALAEISTDLQKYGVSEEQYANLSKAIQQLAGNVGTSAQNTAIVSQTGAAVQANTLLGIFQGAQADNAAFDVKLLDLINKTQQNAPVGGTQNVSSSVGFNLDVGKQDEALQKLQKDFADIQTAALAGLEPTNSQLISIVTNTFKAQSATNGLGSLYDQLKATGDDALNKGILNYLSAAGLSTEQLNSLTQQFGLTLDDIGKKAEDLSGSFDKARQSASQAFATRALQLQISKNSGDFEKNAAGLKVLTDQNNQALATNNALIDSIEQLSSSAMVDLNQALSGIIGLQGQYLTQTELASGDTALFADRVVETTGKLIENAVAAGVNAEGIRKIQIEAAKLIGIINAIPAYKQVIIDIQERIRVGDDRGGTDKLYQAMADAQASGASSAKAAADQLKQIQNLINKLLGSGKGSGLGKLPSASKAAAAAKGPDVSQIDLPDEIANATNRSELIQEAIKRARALQKTIPGANLAASDDIVALLKGTQNILNVRGIKDDYLRRALEELADIEKKRLDFETKADTIRRIRIGAGDFSAIANVPINSKTGVSLGSPAGPITISLNVAGQILTPAQLAQFADMVAAALKRQIANG